MDACKVCGTLFKRHYLRGGVRQTCCSKKCKYAAGYVTRTCATCGKEYRVNHLSTRKQYCSLACIERSPCQLCGTVITGRAKFQSGERRFCSRQCAAVVNHTLQAKKNYLVIGFASTIAKTGSLACERCKEADPRALVVHHIDRNRSNNSRENLITLCANCHFREHWLESANRVRIVQAARYLAQHRPDF